MAECSKSFTWHLMSPDDNWQEIVDFDRSCYPSELCVTVEWYKEKAAKGFDSWRLLDGSRLVANVQLREHESGSLYITGIAVAKAYRRQGLGRHILESLGLRYPGRSFVARIQEGNAASLALFTQSGFLVTGEQTDRHGLWRWVRRDASSTVGH